MPQMASIVINDAEATPVAHSLDPVTTDGSTARLANRSATTPRGFETLSVEVKQPAGNQTAYRILIGFNDPVEATVDGAQVVVRNCSADIRLNFGQDSTAQERKNLLKLMSNLLAHATIVSVADKLEPIY
jgi:hypothetical protein